MNRPHDFLSSYLPYNLSEAQRDNIIESVPIKLAPDIKDQLLHKLSACFTRYLNEKAWHTEPTPSTVIKELDGIVSAADRLLAFFSGEHPSVNGYLKFRLTYEADSYGEENGGYPNQMPITRPVDDSNPDFGGYIDYKGAEQFREAIHGIVLMREWARRAKKADEPNVGVKKGNAGDGPLQNLLVGLGDLWADISGRRPTFSTPPEGGEPYGPFVRFVQACLNTLQSSLNDPRNKLGLELTADAIKARYARAKIQKRDEGISFFKIFHGQG